MGVREGVLGVPGESDGAYPLTLSLSKDKGYF